MIDGKCAQHRARFVDNRLRPARAKASFPCQSFIWRPERMSLDVFDNDPLAGEGCGTTRPYAGTNEHSIDRLAIELWQAGSGSMVQRLVRWVQEQDGAKHFGMFGFNSADDGIENFRERSP